MSGQDEGSTFGSNRSVLVAVVPLGEAPGSEEHFVTYHGMLLNFTEISVADLSRPGDWKAAESPFKYFSWHHGSLKFSFIDRSHNGTGEWDDFQAHRRIWGVIGILFYPLCPPERLRTLEADWKDKVALFPNASVKKLFCFGHTFEGGDVIEGFQKNAGTELVVFPPEGDLEGGKSMVEVHMEIVLNDLAVALFLRLEEEVSKTKASTKKSQQKPRWLNLRSPFDQEDEGDKKGANTGRVQKWLGDLCLLAATPQDAAEQYQAAVTDCKAAGDVLWHAGALEGLIASIVVIQSWGLPLEDFLGREGKSVISFIDEKANDALGLLGTQPQFGPLEVELCFKIAKLHCSARPPRITEAMAYVGRALSVSGLGRHLQVLRNLEAASVCKAMGLKRKFAFLTRMAALQCSDLASFQAAHLLGRIAAHHYGVDLDKIPLPFTPPTRTSLPKPPGPWSSIRRIVLNELILYSTQSKDFPTSCTYYVAMLHLLGELEELKNRFYLISQGESPGIPGGTKPKLFLLEQDVGGTTGGYMPYHFRNISKDSESDFDETGLVEAPGGGGALWAGEMTARGTANASWNFRSTTKRPTSLAALSKFTFKRSGTSYGGYLKSLRGGKEGGGTDDQCQANAGESLSMLAHNVAASIEEQEAYVGEMMKATKKLSPTNDLNVKGIIGLKFIRPLRTMGDLKPVESGGAEEKEQTSSAFIYTPFGDKNAVEASVLWVCGEVAQVLLGFINPLAIPIQLQEVELVIERDGMDALCYPLTLWIPPGKKIHTITLSVKPLRPGDLVIKGVQVKLLNVLTVLEVDCNGCGTPLLEAGRARDVYPRRVKYSRGQEDGVGAEGEVATNKVRIVPSLPRLSARLDGWNTTTVELYPGEYRTIPLELLVGNEVGLGFMEMTLMVKAPGKKEKASGGGGVGPVVLFSFGKQDKVSEEPFKFEVCSTEDQEDTTNVISVDQTSIETLCESLVKVSQPYSDLKNLQLPLVFRRSDMYPEADLVIKYSDEPHAKYHRLLTVPFRFHMTDGLDIADIFVESASFDVPPLLLQAIEGSFSALRDGYICSSESSTLRRKFDIDTDHDVSHLILDMRNLAEEDLYVESYDLRGLEVVSGVEGDLAPSIPMVIRCKGSRRLYIPLRRVSPMVCHRKSKLLSVSKAHAEISLLRLYWSDRHGNRVGLLTVPVDSSSPAKSLSLEKLRLPPFRLFTTSSQFSESIVNKTGRRRIEIQIGDFVPFCFTATNRLEIPMPSDVLCFCHVYQDFTEGNSTVELDSSRILWSGAPGWKIVSLAPRSSYNHGLHICFLSPGLYRIGFCCHLMPQGTDSGGVDDPFNKGEALTITTRIESSLPVVYWGHEELEVLVFNSYSSASNYGENVGKDLPPLLTPMKN